MPTENMTAYVLADNEAPETKRAIEIVLIANEKQIKRIIEILDGRVD